MLDTTKCGYGCCCQPRDDSVLELERLQKPKRELYIPLSIYGFLTLFYDSLTRCGARESAFENRKRIAREGQRR